MNANEIVATTAETVATANRAYLSIAGLGITIERRRVAGKTRIRITARRHNHLTGETAERTEYRDFATRAEADSLFAAQLTKWNDCFERHVAMVLGRTA